MTVYSEPGPSSAAPGPSPNLSRYRSLRQEAAECYHVMTLSEAAIAHPWAIIGTALAFVLIVLSSVEIDGFSDYLALLVGHAFAAGIAHSKPHAPAWQSQLGLTHDEFVTFLRYTLIFCALLISAFFYVGFVSPRKDERAALLLERIAYTLIGGILGTVFGIRIAG